ncbi:MAG: hypothetical protein JWN06_2377, partial [Propionibacteriaceae bacterium]|nr:hypothetical protein [Propionibacteriaceae bacterium]
LNDRALADLFAALLTPQKPSVLRPWIQVVDATDSVGWDNSRSRASAGVSKLGRLRGRALSSAVTWWSSPGP